MIIKKLILIINLLLFLLSCTQKEYKRRISDPKLVIISPEIAEIVCALGGEKNILAVTNECNYPNILNSKLKVGSFSTPNIEKIASLNPNIVFSAGLEQKIITEKLRKLGIQVYQFYPTNIDELLLIIRKIGKIIGKEDKANKLIKNFKISLQNINKPSSKPVVYVEIYSNPIMTVSAESFVGDVINKSGGENAFHNLPRDYCRISPEKIIEKNPDIIIITNPHISKSDIKNRLGWKDIYAIRRSKIYDSNDINTDLIVRAGPRTIEGIKILSKIFRYYEK